MEIEKLQDFEGTLKKFNKIIQNLIKLYGKNAIIRTDAGHNNVSFIISNNLNDKK